MSRTHHHGRWKREKKTWVIGLTSEGKPVVRENHLNASVGLVAVRIVSAYTMPIANPEFREMKKVAGIL
jgi:hypothetical protein